jgi:hypothetical protein
VANYTKATDFASKDALLSGNPAKIIKGTEIDTEYNAIAVAISTKADLVSPTFTGTPAAPTASPGTNTTQVATTAFVGAAVTAATGSLGTMSSQNANNVAITGGSITGITDLAVADGGTGVSALTADNVILGDGTNPVKFVAPGTSGNVLISNGTTWTSAALSTITSFDVSAVGNGYQKLPSGLIIQWGTASQTTGTVTFPITFPNNCLVVVMGLKDSTYSFSWAPIYISTTSWTNSQFSRNDTSTSIGGSRPWIAIGN